MWTITDLSTFEETELEVCFRCRTSLVLLPVEGKTERRIAWICALCAKELFAKGVLELGFNPSARKSFRSIQFRKFNLLKKREVMPKLCRDCTSYKRSGFSPLCKYCRNDGLCPECGEQMTMGMRLSGPAWICSNGHQFDKDGKEIQKWNPTSR